MPLTPVDPCLPTVTVGPYVLLDSPLNVKAIFGYGVDRGVAFENELAAKWGVPAFVFDHTIESAEVPELGPNVTYTPEGIGAIDKGPTFTLDKHVRQFGHDGQDIILKLDIHGYEWDVLRECNLANVAQLVVTMHDMNAAPAEVIARLGTLFHLVHIHGDDRVTPPNFQLDRAKTMPRVLEATWARKDLVASSATPRAEPVGEMSWWLPTEHPVSFVTTDPEHIPLLRRMVAQGDEVVGTIEEATKEYVLVLEKGDVVPVDIIMGLTGLIEANPDAEMIASPVVYNGLVSVQARFYKRGTAESSNDKTRVTERMIYNFREPM
jgi:hypothetical protein